jgi:arylsulfatase A-like enzyme
VANLDVAPTVLELAGVARPTGMDGHSLVPLFSQSAGPWRDSLVIEYFSDTVFPRILKMGYQALRTERWKYIRYTELRNMDELYDLAADPYELKNLIADSAHRADRDLLSQKLDELLRSPER